MLPLTIFLTPSQPVSNTGFDQNSLNTSLYAWGLNSSGQLGDGTTINKPSAVLISNIINGKSFAQIVSGTAHNLAIDTNGALYAWGNNQYGQLGSNTTSNSASPIQISTGTSFTAVGTANNTSYATDTTGRLFAWGDNSQNQVGDGTTVNKSSPTQIYGYYYPNSGTYQSWKFLNVGNLTPTIYTIRQSDSSLWGWNNTYILGINNTTTSFVSPVKIGSSSWSKISSSGSHTAGITTTGALFTWGGNAGGQLGDGTTIDKSSPVQIGTSSWASVAAASSYTAGITSTGALFTWGYGLNGVMGDGQQVSKSSPVQIGTSSWTSVDAGLSHTAGITTTGALFTWGGNTNGQLGDGTTINKSSPVQVPTTITTTPFSWKLVSSNGSTASNAVAIKSDGSLWVWGGGTTGALGLGDALTKSSPVQLGTSSWTTAAAGQQNVVAITINGALWAWGLNATGQLGDGTTINKSSPVQIGTSSWTMVAATNSVTAGITSTGALFMWGLGASGQLGDGTTINKSSPVQIGTSSWSMVSLGGQSTTGMSAAIDIYGNLYTWGLNTAGTLGDNTAVSKSSPVLITTTTSVTNTVASTGWSKAGGFGGGGAFAASGGIRTDGSLYTWGSTNGAQLGSGAGTSSRSSPVQISVGNSFTVITGGISNAMAIRSDGGLFTWGASITGANGNGSTATVSAPTQISVGNSFTMVCGHQSLSGAIQSNGTLWMWGTGAGGGLGVGSTANQLTASFGPTFSSFSMVATGVSHTVAISTSGGLFTWGANLNAQLGDNSLTSKITATTASRIISASTFTVCAAGAVHGMAIDSNGRLWSWGTAAAGQLGDNSVLQKSNPVLVGSSTWTKIAAGASHCMGITTSGALHAWGLNSTGQLGLGDTINRSNPTQIGSSSWAFVACGLTHSAAIDINGNLWMCGQGTAGAMGNGVAATQSVLVQVPNAGGSTSTTTVNNPESWTTVSAGFTHTAAIHSTKALYTWGYGNLGALGSGTTTTRSSPVSIDAGTTSAPAGWSTSFDGSTQYLTATSANFTFAGDFTVEGWYYPTNVTGGHTLFCLGTETTSRYVVSLSGTSVTTNLYGGGTTTFTSTVPINTWTHVAVVRSGSTIKVYINGTASATTETQAGTIGNGALKIAADSGGSALFAGNISNFRVVKGVAVYTINFTSSAVPIGTYNGSATSILTCNAGPFGSTNIVDMSTNAQSITNTGVVRATGSNTPFTRTIAQGSWTAVSMFGGGYSFAIKTTGALFAWGVNAGGQLGDGTTLDKSSPVQIGSSSYTLVSAGNLRGHAITTAGVLYSWGNPNGSTSLGDGTTIAKSSPVQVSAYNTAYTYGSWNTVSAGLSHTAGITNTGALYTWGGNNVGQLGSGVPALDKSSPVQVGLLSWTKVAAGNFHTAGITTTGALFTWGGNGFGELGDSTIIAKSSPVQIGSSSWTQIEAKQFQTYGLTTTGILYAWGSGSATAGLGDGTTVSKSSPVQIPNATYADAPSIAESSFKSIISTGYGNFAYAVSANAAANLYSWGANSGNPTSNTAYPLVVNFNNSYPDYNSWKIIDANGQTSHSMAVKADGSLWAWGKNNTGQLGDGTTIDKSSPVQIGTSSWTTVYAAVSFTLGITTTGALYAWGGNNTANLGDGTTINKSSPVQIGSLSWTMITAGLLGSSAGITTTGALYMWGDRNFIPPGSTARFSSPVQIGTSSWSMISLSDSEAAGIDVTGRLFTWGDNLYGNLGDGTTINKSSPVQIGSSSWTKVSAGSYWTAGITITGALFTWGTNPGSTLGDGTTTDKSSPVQIGTSSWTTVSAGSGGGYAITTTGALFTWGTGGLIGDGTTVSKSSPVQIGTSSWSKISAGGGRVAGITIAGALYAWGYGTNGNLGDGTTINKSSPVIISTIPSSAGLVISKITTTNSGASLFLDTTNQIASIGTNSFGELGTGSIIGVNNNYYPTPGVVFGGVKNIFSGNYHNAALAANNTLYVWGDNSKNQIGLASLVANTPTALNTLYYASSWRIISVASTPGSHVTAIKSDGSLWSWGSNTNGNLGDGTTIGKSSPVQIGSSSWNMVSAGNSHTAAITTSGALYVWGLNTFGQLGDGTTINQSSPVQIGSSSWTTVTAGSSYTAAINTTGALFTWGVNGSGQLGDGTTIDKSSPVQIGSSSWNMVSLGVGHTAGIITTGALFTWGNNITAQLGDGTATSRSSPVQVAGALTLTNSWKIVSVSPGSTHTVAIRASDSSLWAWGDNTQGQLGDGTTTRRILPVKIGDSSWTTVTTGSSYTAGITTTGALFTWGGNTTGQIGDGTTINKSSPVQIGSSSWTMVAATATSATVGFSAAIDITGALYVWGSNTVGNLGDGTTINKSSPVQIGTSSWTTVSVGLSHTAGITTTGALFLWGAGAGGALGDNTAVSKSSPVQLGTLSWTKVSTGASFTMGITTTGALYAWGSNSGQLGDNTITARSSPVQIGNSSWTTVSAGVNTLAITSAGALYAWGFNNTQGQLGDGSQLARSSPVQIGTSSWSKISAGNSHTAGITITGALFTWGDSFYGQLGIGINGGGAGVSRKLSPVQVASSITPASYSSYSTVSAGNSHTAAITTSGALYTWGGNVGGQLGDGTAVIGISPTQIGTSSWTTVSAGNSFTAGITITGDLYAWGYNFSGQLGDGTNIVKSSPVQIGVNMSTASAGVSNVASISNRGNLFISGGNNVGQLGDGTTIGKSSPVKVTSSSVSLTANIAAVATGSSHTVFANYGSSTHTIYSLGDNTYGQLGYTTPANTTISSYVTGNYPYLNNVYAGGNHTFKR